MRYEELMKDSKFRKIAEKVKRFASKIREESSTLKKKKCYRLVSRPDRELELWEKFKGYNIYESYYKRYVCTANKYLGWMLKELSKKEDEIRYLPPPFIEPPKVMIETKHLSRDCVCYSDASVSSYPIIRGYAAHDVYVSQKDLILAECYVDHNVPIESIEKIYIDKDADKETKKLVNDFARKYGIKVVEGFPEPDEETKKDLLDIAEYLVERTKKCPSSAVEKTPCDSIVAALAEVYDAEFFKHETKKCACPIGASDAIKERNKRLRETQFYTKKYGILFTTETFPPEECDKP